MDVAFRAIKDGFDVREVPIAFTERELGESKLDGSFVKDSLLEVTKWGVAHRSEQISDFTSEVSKIASRTVKDMELGPKATTAKNAVSDFVSEVSNLAKGTFKK